MQSVKDSDTVSSVSEEVAPVLSGPKRHHYLSRFYLERFVGADGCVSVYDRDSSTIRRQQPQNTAVIGHFYTLRDEQGRQRFELEVEMGKIEADASSIISALVSKSEITDQQRATMAYFVALSVVRTPEFISSLKQSNADLIKRVSKIAFSNPEVAKNAVIHSGDEALSGDELEARAERLVNFLHSDDYEIVVDHQHTLGLATQLSDTLAPILFERNWTVIRAPENKSFITSDCPVHLGSIAPTTKNRFYGTGFGSADAIILMALDSENMLSMSGFGRELHFRRVDGSTVRRTNIVRSYDCQRYLIGRDDSLVSSIANASRIGEKGRSPRFVVG